MGYGASAAPRGHASRQQGSFVRKGDCSSSQRQRRVLVREGDTGLHTPPYTEGAGLPAPDTAAPACRRCPQFRGPGGGVCPVGGVPWGSATTHRPCEKVTLSSCGELGAADRPPLCTGTCNHFQLQVFSLEMNVEGP